VLWHVAATTGVSMPADTMAAGAVRLPQGSADERTPAPGGSHGVLAEPPAEEGEWPVVARRYDAVLAGEVARVEL
jgi:hypothetical protein